MDDVNQGECTIIGGHQAAAMTADRQPHAAGLYDAADAAVVDGGRTGRERAGRRIPQRALCAMRLLKKARLRIDA